MRPHRRQPTRLHRPWDSPGKNTGVGCHFLLQCVKVKSESEVAQSCPTLRDSMDHSPPGSSVHGIFQASVLEWVAIATPKPYSFLPSQPAFRELNSGERQTIWGFPCGPAGKESASSARDLCSVPRLGRSLGEGTATHSSILVTESDTTGRLSL